MTARGLLSAFVPRVISSCSWLVVVSGPIRRKAVPDAGNSCQVLASYPPSTVLVQHAHGVLDGVGRKPAAREEAPGGPGIGGARRQGCGALGFRKELGEGRQSGLRADPILLDGNPLADIRNTRKIWQVIQNGRLVDREAILKMIRPQ